VVDSRFARRTALRIAVAFTFLVAFGPLVYASEREAQLEQLRNRIDKLQRDLNNTVGKRDTARDELQTEERRIDDLMRSLRATDVRLKQQTRGLADLKRREQRDRLALREQLLALETQVRAAYTLGRQPYLKILLNQESPAAAARVLAYYRYFNQARLDRIDQTQMALARLEQLENEIREGARELGTLRTAQDRERDSLEASRRRRSEMVANLNRQVTGQTQEIARLRADEERLARLLRELKALLPETNVPFPGPNERFASLKGRLPLPAAGRVTARYGQPKGVGDLTWRGIFLAGNEGQNVYAVSRGRVAFADWLRGFGLLLILDHGDGYMTLYGHNETLHKHAGDWVDAGQVIAAIGNTGDAPGTGVYFEIRHNGIPRDPLQWCASGRTGATRNRR
jgi:septal ring factor EnvC (AmiA/AmiB activator)